MLSIRTGLLLAATVLCAAGESLAAKPPATAVAFTPDGKAVVVGSQAGIVVRSWPGLKPVRTLKTELQNVHDLAFSPDGKWLLAAGGEPGETGNVEVFSWDRAKPQAVRGGHDDVVYGVAWRRDSMGWITASLDRSLRTFSRAESKPGRKITGHSRGVKTVGILPDGKTFVSGGNDNSLRVWSLQTGKLIRSLNNHTLPIHDLAVRPVARRQPADRSKPEAQAKGRATRPSLALQASIVPPMIVTVSEDRSVRLWQPTIGRMVRFVRLDKAVPLAVRWTPDGGRIVIACSDGRLRVIDPDTVAIVQDTPAITGWTYSLDVHPNGREAVVGGADGAVRRVVLKRKP
jgi:WD40 repeat protein